jgi:hypothetical protein
MNVNFSGTWHANLSKSRFLKALPKAVSINIEHSGPELLEEILVTKDDCSEDRVVFKCRTNGEPDTCSLNGNPIRGSARWESDELIIESWLRLGAREMHFCDCWSLSSDRRTLTMEHRNDDLAGQLTILDLAE